MKNLNANTKKAHGFICSYNRAIEKGNGNSLYYVYKTASLAKQRAFDYCNNLANEMGGYDRCVVGGNSMKFTYGFKYVDGDGVVKLAYITADNDYSMDWI